MYVTGTGYTMVLWLTLVVTNRSYWYRSPSVRWPDMHRLAERHILAALRDAVRRCSRLTVFV